MTAVLERVTAETRYRVQIDAPVRYTYRAALDAIICGLAAAGILEPMITWRTGPLNGILRLPGLGPHAIALTPNERDILIIGAVPLLELALIPILTLPYTKGEFRLGRGEQLNVFLTDQTIVIDWIAEPVAMYDARTATGSTETPA